MIARLQGNIVERNLESVVVDVGGVGYEVFCSSVTLADVQNETRVLFWIYTSVREDAITLFGFSSHAEKEMFTSLLKVNGVGPKMALKILSASRLQQLAEIIESGDVAALSKLPKVGKKTAEQLVVTLKGKLGVTSSAAVVSSTGKQEIASALVNLGYRPQEVEKVVAQMPADIDLQTGLRQGLTILSQQL